MICHSKGRDGEKLFRNPIFRFARKNRKTTLSDRSPYTFEILVHVFKFFIFIFKNFKYTSLLKYKFMMMLWFRKKKCIGRFEFIIAYIRDRKVTKKSFVRFEQNKKNYICLFVDCQLKKIKIKETRRFR